MHPEDPVVTGEAVALDLRTAGAGSRGIAALVDLTIIFAAQILLIVVVVLTDWANAAAAGAVTIVVEVLVVLGYPVATETLWRGRTVGKAMMGLRVVRDDGGPIRFRHAFVRGLVGVVLDKPGITLALGALIPMLATTRTKRLGDMAGGTIVLQDRVPGRVDTSVAMPPALAGWAAGLDLSGVDDALALRLRQFLGRATQLAPHARLVLEQQLAGEVVARVGAPPADPPGWAIISAVLAERRRRAFVASQSATDPQWTASAATPAEPPRPASGFTPPG
jgi:uncharacterized RDD family membrane protein YckC